MNANCLALFVLVAAFPLSGCSSKDTSASGTPAASAGVKTIELTAYDSMKYSQTVIEAKTGETIRVVLTNAGTVPKEAMAHNWVLLKAGSDPQAYSNAAVADKADNYQPPALAGEVLASIPLQGPKEHGEVTFTVPSQPGEYPYLCSFPAHFMAGMHGALIVH